MEGRRRGGGDESGRRGKEREREGGEVREGEREGERCVRQMKQHNGQIERSRGTDAVSKRKGWRDTKHENSSLRVSVGMVRGPQGTERRSLSTSGTLPVRRWP